MLHTTNCQLYVVMNANTALRPPVPSRQFLAVQKCPKYRDLLIQLLSHQMYLLHSLLLIISCITVPEELAYR